MGSCMGMVQGPGATVKTDGQPWVASGEKKGTVRHLWGQGHHGCSIGTRLQQSFCSASRHWNVAYILAYFYITCCGGGNGVEFWISVKNSLLALFKNC